MHYSSIFTQRRCRPTTPSLQYSIAFLRFMGGGPRTLPGGLNKWQWKRLHEKKAREKENRLLEQEKQIYQARIRSEIRAKSKLSAASQNPSSEPDPDQPGPNHGPLSPQEHVRALAHRFMKEGAEDLWNEADGPIKIPPLHVPKRRVFGEPIDIQKLISKKSGFTDNNGVNESRNLKFSSDISPRARKFSSGSLGLTGNCGNGTLVQPNNWLISRRISGYAGGLDVVCGNGSGISMNLNYLLPLRCYSVDARGDKRSKRFNFARKESSACENGDSDSEGNLIGSGGGGGGRVRWPRFRLNRNGVNSSDDESDDDVEEESEERRGRGNVERMMSSAALGKYDVRKIKKRTPLKFLEEEDDLSRHVEMICKEVSKRSLEEHGGEKSEDETIYSSKS